MSTPYPYIDSEVVGVNEWMGSEVRISPSNFFLRIVPLIKQLLRQSL